MDDLISRQEAITAIQEAYADTEGGADKCAVWKNVGLTNALHIMQDLQSAQPYSEAELQKMQELEQAELQKAYECGRASAQPEINPAGIDYYYCSNAMLKMRIDNVLTDGEYNKIMDKLNDFERRRREKENG